MGQPVLRAKAICKDFGPVRVLFDVDVDLMPGEVHAVIGENGAGKSTLMKILAGYERATEGVIELDGRPVHVAGGGAAERLGIVMIHQEFNLADDLTVEENIFLGRELRRGPFLNKRDMRASSRRVLDELECDVDPGQRVRYLSVSEKQMVEIAKAVSRDARILIMDEPTAVLTRHETDVLFRLIQRLKQNRVTIVYISHKLDEVEQISDRVTVLRDGRLVTTCPTSELNQDEMASLMVGRDIHDMYPPKRAVGDADVVLAVERLSVPGWVRDVSFELRRGEVLGFAGLIGAGRTELMEGLLGLRPRTVGRIYCCGRPVTLKSVWDARQLGIVYLTEDRKGKGLLVDKPLRPNLTLLSLDKFCRPFIDELREMQALREAVETFDINVPHLETTVNTLSGGNQQKLALAKMMQVEPEILILDEPTRGIDVGTKREIYHFIQQLTEQGKSVILISSELPEIIGLSHRVAVMRSGVLTGVLEGDDINEAEIMRYATGVKGAAQHATGA